MKVGYKSLRKDYITAVCLKQVFFVLFCRRILSKSFSVGSARFAKTLRVLAAPPFFVCIRDPSPYHSKILASPTLCFLTGKIKSNRIIPPRSRGGSPKEIQQSIKGISFGEKGAGKRKIGAHRRFYVNFLVECRVISQFFAKTFKCHKPKASDGAAGGGKRIAYSTDPPP